MSRLANLASTWPALSFIMDMNRLTQPASMEISAAATHPGFLAKEGPAEAKIRNAGAANAAMASALKPNSPVERIRFSPAASGDDPGAPMTHRPGRI
jgi:hypothetical protein